VKQLHDHARSAIGSRTTTMPVTNAWVHCLPPNPQAQRRLFCFPYAGGGASLFRTWHHALPPAVEVCAIQLPGRETRLRETPFDHLPLLIDVLLPVLRPYLDKPFALFGHSMGALICFELARRLRTQCQLTPAQLFVSGRGAPQLPQADAPLHGLPDPDFLAGVRQRYQNLPDAVLQDAEMVELILPLLRGDFTLLETYAYSAGTPLACPIAAFGGRQDEHVHREALAAWREQTSHAFTLRLFAGDHFYLTQQPGPLLAAMAELLEGDRG
jgi:medium-chain acyl-[acyl-carrier-protein] hydrolase